MAQQRAIAYVELVGSRWAAYKPNLSRRHNAGLTSWHATKRESLRLLNSEDVVTQAQARAVCRLFGWSY
jgi:hypothetical protein